MCTPCVCVCVYLRLGGWFLCSLQSFVLLCFSSFFLLIHFHLSLPHCLCLQYKLLSMCFVDIVSFFSVFHADVVGDGRSKCLFPLFPNYELNWRKFAISFSWNVWAPLFSKQCTIIIIIVSKSNKNVTSPKRKLPLSVWLISDLNVKKTYVSRTNDFAEW